MDIFIDIDDIERLIKNGRITINMGEYSDTITIDLLNGENKKLIVQ